MNPRLLFVDDDPRISKGLQRALSFKSTEWEMHFVQSGIEALTLLEQMICDVIVSDLRMPGMNGIELLGRVKLRHPQIARIVLSGETGQEQAAASAVAQRYLNKPCDPEMLIFNLEAVLRERLAVATAF